MGYSQQHIGTSRECGVGCSRLQAIVCTLKGVRLEKEGRVNCISKDAMCEGLQAKGATSWGPNGRADHNKRSARSQRARAGSAILHPRGAPEKVGSLHIAWQRAERVEVFRELALHKLQAGLIIVETYLPVLVVAAPRVH